MKLILPNSIMSKKNSKRIYGFGKFKKVLPSEAYLAWEEEARRAVVSQLSCDFKLLTGEICINAQIYYKGARPDLSGCLESIGDSLEGVLFVNDRQIVSWDGSHLYHDLENPRTELSIDYNQRAEARVDKKYQCHVCKVKVGEKHLPFCSVGNDVFYQ